MKKGIYIFSTVALLFLLWYFFFKTADYTINFVSGTFPQTINQSLKLWDYGLENSIGLEEFEDFNHLRQTYTISDSLHTYDWHIKALTDSTSQVTIAIKDKNLRNSLMNRLQVPFSKTNFTTGSEKIVFDFMTVLKDHVDNFKVNIIGIKDIPEKLIAFVPLKTAQIDKAKGMMENSTFIGQVLVDHNIELDGSPIIEVTQWHTKKDSLEFNFGYPVMPGQEFPTDTEIQYKKIKAKKGIKAIYNGNYITSDRAWYALLNYAKKNDLNVEARPVEIFFNNPDMGGNSLNWKAEIYLPLASDQ